MKHMLRLEKKLNAPNIFMFMILYSAFFMIYGQLIQEEENSSHTAVHNIQVTGNQNTLKCETRQERWTNRQQLTNRFYAHKSPKKKKFNWREQVYAIWT